MSWRRLGDNGHNGHAKPDIEQASAEVFGRLLAITDQLERLIEQREQELREDEERG